MITIEWVTSNYRRSKVVKYGKVCQEFQHPVGSEQNVSLFSHGSVAPRCQFSSGGPRVLVQSSSRQSSAGPIGTGPVVGPVVCRGSGIFVEVVVAHQCRRVGV